MGIDVVGLANNHIMDHGAQGLRTTIETLDERRIARVGAGENIREARTILVREVKGIRIGILAVAEHEFGIANDDTPGANPMDIIDLVRNVGEHRSEFDTLIVLVHGGNEHLPYPRPDLMDTCRFMVEQGASAVICQHSHCTGCLEVYQGAPIVYGQGNFLFDMPSSFPTWNEGCLVQLLVDPRGNCEARMIPFHQAGDAPGARHMTQKEETDWRSAFDERSRHLGDQRMIEEMWRTFCRTNKRYYFQALHGRSSLLRRLAARLDIVRMLDSAEERRARLNIIRCESHRAALRTILEAEAAPAQKRKPR
jgi:poly-gamma-glutamate synthesis protein (capsule biosynthesis protein)